MSNLEIAKHSLKSLEDGSVSSSVTDFFAPEFVQIEYPNRLNPNGGKSDLQTMLTRFEQGKKTVTWQTYDIQSMVESGNTFALQVLWTAMRAVPVGTLAAGSPMTAHFAVFLEFRDGKLVAQRNYDCFEPW
jgi:ketosteroid isomerase-like protein